MSRFSPLIGKGHHWQPVLRIETLALVVSLYFSITCNGLFWRSLLAGRSFPHATDCLRHRAVLPATHDNLFHSVLGLLDVQTESYDRSMDLAATCRGTI